MNIEAARQTVRSTRAKPAIIDVDIHPKSSLEDLRAHHDLRFMAVAPDGAVPVCSEESIEVSWFKDLPPNADECIARAVRVARAALVAGSS